MECCVRSFWLEVFIMTPHTVAPPPEEEALHAASEEERQPSKAADAGYASQSWHYSHGLFHDSLLELSTTRPRQRTLDFILSMTFHTIFLGTLILVPLFFTEAIDLKKFATTLLVAPPPPPPPPPASPAIARIKTPIKRVFTSGGKLMAPTMIPEKVAMLKEEPLPPDVERGVAGGVPGGVPGGQAGGVIGGIISSAPRTYIPAAPSIPQPKAPVRVGGRVKAPRPIATPEPMYPPLARQAKIQGDVLIDAVIDRTGNVVEMRVISGHPLLIQPATDALRKWRYEPTYLNDVAVPVQLIVTVRFRLGS